jgi:hypothetical protein
LAAEAQISVTPTGPTALHVTDPTSTYTATITTNYNFTFYLFVLNNGVQVDSHMWVILQSGPSYNFQSPPLSTSNWGLAIGNSIDYRGRAMLSARVGVQVDWYVTVTAGSSSMGPRILDGAFAAEALPPNRRRWSIEAGADSGDLA